MLLVCWKWYLLLYVLIRAISADSCGIDTYLLRLSVPWAVSYRLLPRQLLPVITTGLGGRRAPTALKCDSGLAICCWGWLIVIWAAVCCWMWRTIFERTWWCCGATSRLQVTGRVAPICPVKCCMRPVMPSFRPVTFCWLPLTEMTVDWPRGRVRAWTLIE